MVGDIFINGKDAWEKYRANLEEGSVLEMMIPLPKKDYVESNIRNANGRVLRGYEWDDIKELTLTFHIVAENMDMSFRYFRYFCDDVLAKGKFTLKSRHVREIHVDTIMEEGAYEFDALRKGKMIEFNLIYRNCTPISSNNGILKFSVKTVIEHFNTDKHDNIG